VLQQLEHPHRTGGYPAALSFAAVPPFLAAALQLTSTSDAEANWRSAEELVRRAAALGARLVATPENTNYLGPHDEKVRRAEPLDGPTCRRFGGLAADLGIHVLLGSFNEASPQPGRCFNTSVLFGPEGAPWAVYRKLHLFDVELPGRVSVRESATRAPGTGVVTVPTELGTLGLSICYDLRFPELYRTLVRAGAEILVVPSAFTFPTGAAHWEVLCRARAVENQCYLIAADQTGTSPHGFADFGDSLIVDPWGRVLARAGDGEDVVTADVDLAYLARVRRELPCLAHVRLTV
jgi:predicted amidohydrolase